MRLFTATISVILIGSAYAGTNDLVFVGDTQDRVYEMLGEPSIEFPKDGCMVRWYAGYEVISSNRVVISVKSRPIMTEEEKQERAYRAELADQRLREAYRASAEKSDLNYEAWLERERKLREQARIEAAKVQAYENRKSREKIEAIRASKKGHSHDVYIHYD